MLNSLVIKNFRCLEDFTVEKLGRVNLIVGKNNSGKSTVLEALRIYAGNAQRELLVDIAISHDEIYKFEKTKFGELNPPMPFEGFFTGRKLPDDETEIVIGDSERGEQTLHISHLVVVGIEESPNSRTLITTKKHYIDLAKGVTTGFVTQKPVLKIGKNNKYTTIHFENELRNTKGLLIYKDISIINCSFIPTQFISIEELAKEWDKIVYTEYENIVINALKIINSEFEHLVFVQSENSATSSRIAKVKLANNPRPVPLKSLGDGMTRILQLALKLVSAQGGFLLIDEFENGLHYSTQEKIWSWLFEVAEQLDIQVFATTHSWDCIESFATVANEKENIEGILFRMGRSARKSNKGQIIATVFDKDDLQTMTQADVEVR